VVRALVARGVQGPKFRGLEIGTLYAVNSIWLYEVVHPFFADVHLTLLDPLEGYYEATQLDPLTQLPVSQKMVETNLRRWSVPAERCTLIKALSTDQEVLKRLSDERYNYLLIDGDHSYAGVKADFDLYGPKVEPGGYLVLDDYGTPEWPDVTRFVDEVVSRSPLFELVGSTSRTAVYRRK
jgi:hypothetical protein